MRQPTLKSPIGFAIIHCFQSFTTPVRTRDGEMVFGSRRQFVPAGRTESRARNSARFWTAAALCRFRAPREKRQRTGALQDAGATAWPPFANSLKIVCANFILFSTFTFHRSEERRVGTEDRS